MTIDMLTTQRFPEDVIAPFLERWSIEQGPPGGLMPHAELTERVAGCRALLSATVDRVDDELMAHAPDLKAIANVGVGYNHIDVAAATRRGIWVTNTPGVLADSVADLTMVLLLGILRRLPEASEHVRHGQWKENRQDTFWGVDPIGLTLGLIGFGAIGQGVARRALAFGMRIIYHTRNRLAPDVEQSLSATYVSFDALVRQSDVLSLHLPLTEETRGLIGAAELAQMKPGSLLVNTARGPIVDEAAMIAALESGQLAGVGLDVTATEPEVPVALREHPRALILPHIASATRGTRGGMMRMALENASAILEGRPPLNPVNQIQ